MQKKEITETEAKENRERELKIFGTWIAQSV
jgi:hypothetical protein